MLLQCELIRWLAAGATGPFKKFANRLRFLKKNRLSFVDIFSLRRLFVPLFLFLFLCAGTICNLQWQNGCSEFNLMCCCSCAFAELPHSVAWSTFLDTWRV